MKIFKATKVGENRCKELYNELNMKTGPTRLVQPEFYLLVDVDDIQKQVNAIQNRAGRMEMIAARSRWRNSRKRCME